MNHLLFLPGCWHSVCAARGKAARSSTFPAHPCPCGDDHPSPRSPTPPHQGSEEEEEEKAAFYSRGVGKAGGDVLSDSSLGWFSQGTGHKEEASTAKYVVMSEPKRPFQCWYKFLKSFMFSGNQSSFMLRRVVTFLESFYKGQSVV